jgi:hypothetical protein
MPLRQKLTDRHRGWRMPQITTNENPHFPSAFLSTLNSSTLNHFGVVANLFYFSIHAKLEPELHEFDGNYCSLTYQGQSTAPEHF